MAGDGFSGDLRRIEGFVLEFVMRLVVLLWMLIIVLLLSFRGRRSYRIRGLRWYGYALYLSTPMHLQSFSYRYHCSLVQTFPCKRQPASDKQADIIYSLLVLRVLMIGP